MSSTANSTELFVYELQEELYILSVCSKDHYQGGLQVAATTALHGLVHNWSQE